MAGIFSRAGAPCVRARPRAPRVAAGFTRSSPLPRSWAGCPRRSSRCGCRPRRFAARWGVDDVYVDPPRPR